jgi:hypothetical protein
LIALLLVAGPAHDAQVARLADPDPVLRRVARSTLLVAGDRAVPALRRGLRAKDPEVSRASVRLLDRLAWRTLRGKRNNADYELRDNRMTRRLCGDRARARRVRFALLHHPRVRDHYRRHFAGNLDRWRKPSRADVNNLLVALARELEQVVEDRDLILQHLLCADAMSAHLENVAAGGHWSTGWLVERKVLAALANTMRYRDEALSVMETQVYGDLLRRLPRFCRDRRTALLCRRLGKRLPKVQ